MSSVVFCEKIHGIKDNSYIGGVEVQFHNLFLYRPNIYIISNKNIHINGLYLKHINLKNPFNFLKVIEEIKLHDNVIFGPINKYNFIYAFISKILKKRTIFFVSNMGILGNNQKGFSKLYRFINIMFLKYIDCIVCQNQKQIRFAKHKYPNKQIELIENNIDINIYVNREFENYVLWVGRNHPVKRIDRLIETIKDMPNINFRVIGVNLNLFPKLKNLKVLGQLSYDDCQKQIRFAKLLISTSESEGYGNVLLEAMNNKVPVVTYQDDSADLISRSNGGVCAYGFYDFFKLNISELYNNNKKNYEMGENGYQFVRQNNSLSKIRYELKQKLDI